MKINNTGIWSLGVVAAFAVGVSTAALMTGTSTPTLNKPVDMTSAAEMLNNIEPTAGDATAQPAAAKPSTDSTPVVATVNGKDVTLGQLEEYRKTMPEQISKAPMEQVFPMVQEQVVMGNVISSKATAAGFENDPEVQQRLAMMRDNVIRATYLEREVNKMVTDATVKAEYDIYLKDFKPAEEINAQHILVDSESTAKDIIKKLDTGAKFEDLVKEFSKDKGTGGDGSLGYFKSGDMVKEFADAAFQLKKGTYSKTPVKTQFGYHVVKLNDRRMSPAPDFATMEPQLKTKLQRDAFEKLIAAMKNEASIEMFDMKGNKLPEPKQADATAPMTTPAADAKAANATEPAAAK